jgi:hypothetical protein
MIFIRSSFEWIGEIVLVNKKQIKNDVKVCINNSSIALLNYIY